MKKSVLMTSIAAISWVTAGSVHAQGLQDADQQWQLLETYCMDCHNFEDFSGGLAFDLMYPDEIPQDAHVWENVVKKLRGRLMPPPGSPQPEQNELRTFVSWMEGTLDDNLIGPAVGHVPLQRLNRTEYQMAVKELLGLDINARDYLPADIEMDGFDNIAEALTISPSFLEQFVGAARRVARQAVGEAVPKLAITNYPLTPGSQTAHEDGMPLGSRGGMTVRHNFPADGEYRITILDLDVGLYPRGMESENTVVVLVDGEEIYRNSLGGLEDLSIVDRGGADGRDEIMSRFTDIPVQVPAGVHDVTVTFVERSRAASAEWVATGGFFGGLRVSRMIDGIEIAGPYNATGLSMSASRQKIFVCEPDGSQDERACASQIAENLARKAYRRPISQSDVDNLMAFYEAGSEGPGGFNAGIEQVVAAVLASPDFLFRSLSSVKDPNESGVYALNDLELASRLSFFLWSQGPDEELLQLAERGELRNDGVLETQVKRMLDDERASAMVNSFALKWLDLNNLGIVEPDPDIFPMYSAALQQDFEQEMRLFLSSVLLEDRPIIELLTADYSYLNQRLARHYGIQDVFGPQFRRVELADASRHGLLGKGAVLLRTSYGDRTSPVLRGAWVLEKIMGTPPSPPPPNVETDLSVPEGGLPTTVRARLEEHRDNPSCNQCHGVIDPIGLALENFTVTGQWRDFDADARVAIDASTVMPNGNEINGPAELRDELASQPDMFAQAMTEKLMMYALNRELEAFDMPRVRHIVREAEKEDYRLSALVLGIVTSEGFLYQGLPHGEDGNLQVSMQSNSVTE